ncbi:hypothetical protein IC620_16275 [Hazenella sp. IB182357]|uniref:Uncharacterized protein n=1 Tax=Polycladospora coralii TaxID=2771432 RepID=A0A926NCU4_9BACL|nr:hypothetical protein [Polycladospora coralii]MBD1373902.1 hypothetical protein [Polycladospora coralii]MBS7529550.1 hypothetical protein [Polycladospora coralii]
MLRKQPALISVMGLLLLILGLTQFPLAELLLIELIFVVLWSFVVLLVIISNWQRAKQKIQMKRNRAESKRRKQWLMAEKELNQLRHRRQRIYTN